MNTNDDFVEAWANWLGMANEGEDRPPLTNRDAYTDAELGLIQLGFEAGFSASVFQASGVVKRAAQQATSFDELHAVIVEMSKLLLPPS